MKITILGVEMEASDKVLYATKEASKEYIQAMKTDWKDKFEKGYEKAIVSNKFSYKEEFDEWEDGHAL